MFACLLTLIFVQGIMSLKGELEGYAALKL